MDNIIQPTIVLLILSLITEKISNFIKLQYKDISDKDKNNNTEKLKEKKIQKLTIIVGICVAILTKANFFEIFKLDYDLFWTADDFKGFDLLSNIVGSIISGMFLSLGSKFFHDLLDMLLQVKNLKRKLNDKADWEFENISEVDEYIKGNDLKKLKDFLDETFKTINGYFFYELDYENNTINVHVRKGTKGIQNLVPYRTLTGKSKLFKVKLIEEDNEIRTLALTINPSDEIANQNAYSNTLKGSVSYPVIRNSDKKTFIMTCYHAVWNKNHDWDIFIPIGKEKVVHPSNGTIIGEIKFAIKNSQLDVALIEPENNIDLSVNIPLLDLPKNIREVDEMDAMGKTIVKIKSITKNHTPSLGYISDLDYKVNIKYPDGNYRSLSKLILIKPYDNSPFSIGGDSGSLVVDEWGYAVGIVVAGNESDITFAIPITTIFNSLNLNIKQS